jgi:uncharacterized protein (TIGR00159 family)
MMAFISMRFLDFIDILLVTLLLYQLYRLLKGTVAFNIIIGLFSLYLLWLIVKLLNMELIGAIMGQFIGVGVLALIIVFHPEIRKFLVFVGTHYNVNKVFALDKLMGTSKKRTINQEQIDIMVDACISMAKSHTGALIVITNTLELNDQVNSGERLNAKISSSLIRTIFFKNSPLHDGAVIIRGNRIAAAGCILPLTQKEIDKSMGLRHRAAIGITENSDAVCIIVSEEKGTISFAKDGEIIRRLTKEKLITLLEENIQSVE